MMSIATKRISQLILDELSHGESRLLVLIVAVRRGLNPAEGIKGDLSAAVKCALRKLITSKQVMDIEGVYALAPSARGLEAGLRSMEMMPQHA